MQRTLAQMVSRWHSSQFGPIVRIWGTVLGLPDPRWWIFGAELARAPVGNYHSARDFAAAGASVERSQARARMLGEAIERHSAVHAISDAPVFDQLLADSSIRERFARCAETEPAPPLFKRGQDNVAVSHVLATVVRTGRRVAVPTPYVHLGYLAPSAELLATYPISTGTAFASSRTTALWRGLCEVAERDAVMLWWLTRSGFRQIDTSSTRNWPDLEERLGRLRATALQWRLLDITTDFGVPTVLALVYGDAYPYVAVGASCHSDPIRACCKSLDEAVSVRYSLQLDRWQRDVPSFTDFGWVRQLEDHMLLYGSWHDAPPLRFIEDAPSVGLETFAQSHTIAPPRTMAELRSLCRALDTELGLTVLSCDLTTPEVREIGQVWKVVVPEMVPLSQDHRARWLDTPRLLRRFDDQAATMNDFPHPFA